MVSLVSPWVSLTVVEVSSRCSLSLLVLHNLCLRGLLILRLLLLAGFRVQVQRTVEDGPSHRAARCFSFYGCFFCLGGRL